MDRLNLYPERITFRTARDLAYAVVSETDYRVGALEASKVSELHRVAESLSLQLCELDRRARHPLWWVREAIACLLHWLAYRVASW